MPTPSGRSAVRSSNRGVPEPKEDGKTETKKDDVVADLASKFAETDIDVTDEKISSAEMLHRQVRFIILVFDNLFTFASAFLSILRF